LQILQFRTVARNRAVNVVGKRSQRAEQHVLRFDRHQAAGRSHDPTRRRQTQAIASIGLVAGNKPVRGDAGSDHCDIQPRHDLGQRRPDLPRNRDHLRPQQAEAAARQRSVTRMRVMPGIMFHVDQPGHARQSRGDATV